MIKITEKMYLLKNSKPENMSIWLRAVKILGKITEIHLFILKVIGNTIVTFMSVFIFLKSDWIVLFDIKKIEINTLAFEWHLCLVIKTMFSNISVTLYIQKFLFFIWDDELTFHSSNNILMECGQNTKVLRQVIQVF